MGWEQVGNVGFQTYVEYFPEVTGEGWVYRDHAGGARKWSRGKSPHWGAQWVLGAALPAEHHTQRAGCLASTLGVSKDPGPTESASRNARGSPKSRPRTPAQARGPEERGLFAERNGQRFNKRRAIWSSRGKQFTRDKSSQPAVLVLFSTEGCVFFLSSGSWAGRGRLPWAP